MVSISIDSRQKALTTFFLQMKKIKRDSFKPKIETNFALEM